ncbi:MAG TPA: autotransporter outer membrane beta-barrel domain-containing protein, partial [Piscirickettsiaceae bacterium]|nr:autotransporter outer membrane beta-barrel domain-containing protein [Piscirickettsiaceae bacterium]
TYRSSSSLGQTGNTQTVYDASKTAIAADTAVFQALAGMTTDATINAAIKTMSPSTAGAAAASAAISGSSVNTANTRMAYLRQTGLGKGMNAGGAAKDESMWLQIFGASIDQDTVSSVSGYDADGQGIAIGIDGMSADGTTRIGIAGSFANTDVDGKDSTTKTTEDIDTTQVMVYANKDYADGMYLQGVASYSFNDNTGTRRILVGAVDRTASSNYDSGLFSIDVEAGWPKEDDGVTITPTVGLTFSHLSADTYTETGAGNMNLVVSPTDVNTVEGKVGVKMTGKTVNADGGIGRPEVRVGVSHNFGDDTADSTSTFNAGGASFTTTGVETDSTKVDVGLGYTYTTPEGDTEISVNVDGRHSSSYVQYGSGLTVKWKF